MDMNVKSEYDDALFIVNQNGSIQHSEVAYKEDGEVLIDAKVDVNGDGKIDSKDKVFYEEAGWYKYSVLDTAVDALDIDVDYIDPRSVMPVKPLEEVTISSGSKAK